MARDNIAKRWRTQDSFSLSQEPSTGIGCRARKYFFKPGYSRSVNVSMRESSNISTAMRWNGDRLSAICCVDQRLWPAMCARTIR